MNLVKRIKQWVLDKYEYDRIAEQKIYKSIEIFHKGGSFNHWRAIRMYNRIREQYGCDIWPGITIGTGTYIAHAQGISIGQTSEIGNYCRIYPNCTFSSAIVGDKEKVANGIRRHPKIGDNCIVGEGSSLVGRITIGHNVIIGVGAVVRKNVPSYSIVIGNPAKIVGFTMRPEDAFQNELHNYTEEDRLSMETLENNYEKYFRSRVKDIRNFEAL